jgi:hypothetical protein
MTEISYTDIGGKLPSNLPISVRRNLIRASETRWRTLHVTNLRASVRCWHRALAVDVRRRNSRRQNVYFQRPVVRSQTGDAGLILVAQFGLFLMR